MRTESLPVSEPLAYRIFSDGYAANRRVVVEAPLPEDMAGLVEEARQATACNCDEMAEKKYNAMGGKRQHTGHYQGCPTESDLAKLIASLADTLEREHRGRVELEQTAKVNAANGDCWRRFTLALGGHPASVSPEDQAQRITQLETTLQQKHKEELADCAQIDLLTKRIVQFESQLATAQARFESTSETSVSRGVALDRIADGEIPESDDDLCIQNASKRVARLAEARDYRQGYLVAVADLEAPYPTDIFTPISNEEIEQAVEAMGGTISQRLHAHWARHLAGVLRKRMNSKPQKENK